MMVNTILEYDRRFGVLMLNPFNGEIAKVGCCAEIIHYERLPDDRWKILTLGQQRFRLLEYVREKPFRVGLVEWIDDWPTQEDVYGKAQEVLTLLKDVVRLSAKLTGQSIQLPENLPTQPLELSYWVASNLYGVAMEQQFLLEMQDTYQRLQREAEILSTTRSNLAARVALKDALQ